ncbi:ion transporter [Palleronia caenipelagi]|uniref:Ion transporter n=1 Tax=Palleronia caenipelagi TaxID=2489174 RepID=A0A547QB26_9RHOB|nr:ion transporter [Palleronia caenipelagi]TRD23584.1 ion transporter [Palleronia caenipelagi]
MITKKRARLALEGEDPTYGRAFVIVLYVAIGLTAAAITMESMKSLPPSVNGILVIVEFVLLAVFAIEYAVRVWSAEHRLRYIFSFWGLIDLAAVAPALLLMTPDIQALRSLRLFLALRMLKLLRLNNAVFRIEEALSDCKEELLVFIFLAAIVMFLSAVGIYYFEHEAQPDAFQSIPDALWWAVATFTTVGYGDIYPITTGGRFFTTLTLLVGLGIVAIPGSLITTALLKESGVRRSASASKPGAPITQSGTDKSDTTDDDTSNTATGRDPS